MCIIDHSSGLSCCWPLPRPLPKLAGFQDFPLPLWAGQGQPHCSAMEPCNQPLNPCESTVCNLPQPPVAPFLDVPLKAKTVRDRKARVWSGPPPQRPGRFRDCSWSAAAWPTRLTWPQPCLCLVSWQLLPQPPCSPGLLVEFCSGLCGGKWE